MKIKLDENLSRHLKPSLVDLGHDTTTVAEEGLSGPADAVVGAAAKAEGRLVFTLDLEFGDLRKYPPGDHPGVVLFRPWSMGPRAVAEFILKFMHEENIESVTGCVVIVEPTRVRVRRPPQQTDGPE